MAQESGLAGINWLEKEDSSSSMGKNFLISNKISTRDKKYHS